MDRAHKRLEKLVTFARSDSRIDPVKWLNSSEVVIPILAKEISGDQSTDKANIVKDRANYKQLAGLKKKELAPEINYEAKKSNGDKNSNDNTLVRDNDLENNEFVSRSRRKEQQKKQFDQLFSPVNLNQQQEQQQQEKFSESEMIRRHRRRKQCLEQRLNQQQQQQAQDQQLDHQDQPQKLKNNNISSSRRTYIQQLPGRAKRLASVNSGSASCESNDGSKQAKRHRHEIFTICSSSDEEAEKEKITQPAVRSKRIPVVIDSSHSSSCSSANSNMAQASQCPICAADINGNSYDLQRHVNRCLDNDNQ